MTNSESWSSPTPPVLQVDPPSSMIERTTLILESFDSHTTRLTLEEVTRRTRLPRSTVHRILDKLVRVDWLEHLSSGYRLGRRALGVAGDGSSHAEIRAAAAPLLHELHMQTGMVVHLAVLDRSDSVYLDKVGGRQASSLPTRVGGRSPAYSTADGKSMLAWLDPEWVDSLYPDRLNRCTERTIADISTLHRELDQIRRRRGVAFERGESVRSIASVGVAVRGPEGPVAAISLCGDVRTARLERVAHLVIAVAHETSRALDSALRSARRGPYGPRRYLGREHYPGPTGQSLHATS
ncbi:IclR family transcriptional regulator [Rhodococcus sp. ABRD24]|uniref:IclR family transcriptional regulator n=1 Tax=Rhodococcus sp. ABRD24 TaxID=2507582 RepID=UPI001038B6EB|nr:IclR family transcriptional regulator [Rhodococcus sp. ABRD24]QBJ96814.1 IclR family transcriptional regulator [Rhodococcus sp. ABRD24]